MISNTAAAGSVVPPPPLPGLTKFSFSELEVATHNFLEKNKTGSNHFGTIYKGALTVSHERTMVAIKKFHQSFVLHMYNELHIASKLHIGNITHKNVIIIMGYCHEVNERAVEPHIFLVEEYMPNGDMGNIINRSQLDWTSCFRIILGIAHGVHYLHEQHVLHLDLKPANILLDSDMNPKITNFGIAKNFDEIDAHADNLEGTVGYMPPEYVLEGVLSVKYDVYSFGIIILETISSMCRSEPALSQASVEWAWEARESRQMADLFDPSLCDKSQLAETARCMEIGLLCTQEKPTDRPTMADVLEMLNGNKQLPIPCRPEYTKREARKARKEAHHGRVYICF